MKSPKSDTEAAVAITTWFGQRRREGMTDEAIMRRIQNDASAVAAEIGVTETQLTMDIFEHPDSDALLQAMVGTVVDDIVKHEPDSGLGKLLNR